NTILEINKKINNDFTNGNGFLWISDFEINEAFMDDIFNFNQESINYEDTAQFKYTRFMANKFGEDYATDHDMYREEYEIKLEQEKLEKAKNEINNDIKKDDAEIEL
ncbi:MAG: hypothetical protein CVV59_01425, partial [Tenericutes bacterium HGW-Tenericutes-4]